MKDILRTGIVISAKAKKPARAVATPGIVQLLQPESVFGREHGAEHASAVAEFIHPLLPEVRTAAHPNQNLSSIGRHTSLDPRA